MLNLLLKLYSIDKVVIKWMAAHGLMLLRISMGIVFLWFGLLKFFPGISPAEELAMHTTELLSFGLLSEQASIILVASWESLIGIGLIFRLYMRITLLLLFLQMIGACAPIVLFPGEVFSRIPYAPTIEGQYIIKNIVIISAAMVLGASVSGGKVVPGTTVDKLSKTKGETI